MTDDDLCKPTPTRICGSGMRSSQRAKREGVSVRTLSLSGGPQGAPGAPLASPLLALSTWQRRRGRRSWNARLKRAFWV